MARARVFDARSGDTSSLDLEGPRFTTEPNEHVIHRAVVAELDSRRRYTASTKGRSEIRGSGAKLYRQKGTGRARVGDAKSPIRQGGGTWGGPKAKPGRYGKRINRKEATAAFDGALSAKAQDGELYVLDSLAFDTPSTKQAKELLSRMELEGRARRPDRKRRERCSLFQEPAQGQRGRSPRVWGLRAAQGAGGNLLAGSLLQARRKGELDGPT